MKLKHLLFAMATSLVALQTSAKDYSQEPEVVKFIDRMVQEHNMDRGYLTGIMQQAEYKQSIIDAITRPAEKSLAWFEYRRIFMDSKRIAKGKEFLKKYAETFSKAEQKYGVPRHIIAAIIGVETRYGGYMGNYRIVDALATLGFDYPKRSKFFLGQLEQYFLLVREQNFDAMALTGSYAGAMGYGQFIPSSYRHYAIDFDNDGTADILNNPVDAIGSVANYFAEHGWMSGQPIVSRGVVDSTLDESILNDSLTPSRTVAQLRELGFAAEDEGLADDMEATAMRLRTKHGEEYWMGLKNFYVITRYNHSKLYAMAVYQLSQELK